MTICVAGISKEGIILVSDCRVTYLGESTDPYSDSLLKIWTLNRNTVLAFSGNIGCAQYIIRNLDKKHYSNSGKPV